MKPAPFGDRRMGVGWAGPRRDGLDGGAMLWGGCAVFRELVQRPDGTLGTRHAPELTPARGPAAPLSPEPLTSGCHTEGGRVVLEAWEGQEAAAVAGLPRDCRITCTVVARPGAARFGLGLRGSGRYGACYELALSGRSGALELAGERLEGAGPIEGPLSIEVVMAGDVIDACVGGERTLVNRLPELDGDRLFLFCEGGQVAFEGLAVEPLMQRNAERKT
jgi:hypothetical protein